jgi:hypothetical protein
MKRVAMKKPLLIAIIVASTPLRSMAADLIDSPGPGYRQQMEIATPRVVKERTEDLPRISISLPLTHPAYEPFPAAKLLDSKHSVPPLSFLIINAFSEPIRFTSK